MVKITKREIFKLNKDLKIHNLLNDIADAFNLSYQEGITKTSTDINKKPFAKLSPATIAKKGHSKPLLDKGLMKNTYLSKEATKSSKKAIISPNARDRAIPTVIHNEGLNIVQREWFGIGKVQLKLAKGLSQDHIDKALLK